METCLLLNNLNDIPKKYIVFFKDIETRKLE